MKNIIAAVVIMALSGIAWSERPDCGPEVNGACFVKLPTPDGGQIVQADVDDDLLLIVNFDGLNDFLVIR